MNKNEHHNQHLQDAWNKYEEENFEFSIIEFCEKEDVLKIEQYWIDYYDACNNEKGYNMCPIDGNTAGRKFSEETKEKIRKASTGRKASESARQMMSESRKGEKNVMYGKHHTEDAKIKISKNRADISGENNPFYGKQHSEKTKQILREKAIKRDARPNAKLTEKEVFEIKWQIYTKPKSVTWKDKKIELAKKYNISQKAIENIYRNQRWEKLIVKICIDKKNEFMEMFNEKNGFYVRSGIIDENGNDTGVDPFMRSFPSLIDVGVMGWCRHGESGLCVKSGVQCYQNGLNTHHKNMSLENFRKIVDECKGKTFQFALGGRGDVDQHENFEEILAYCRENGIVPNFTSSGLGFNEEIVKICKKYCGAVAISWYRSKYTNKAIEMLISEGVITNIHYVLGNNSIDEAIERLKNNDFPKGINAIIFLLHKPVGLGQQENVLQMDDPRVKEFFELIDNNKFPFKIGFDSCSVPGLINFSKNVDPNSYDSCEGGRFSMYITSDMKALPCSFDNQDLKWAYDISNDTIQNAWDSEQFEDFRNHFKNSCSTCKNKLLCYGGCPIRREIVLCNKKEKDLK